MLLGISDAVCHSCYCSTIASCIVMYRYWMARVTRAGSLKVLEVTTAWLPHPASRCTHCQHSSALVAASARRDHHQWRSSWVVPRQRACRRDGHRAERSAGDVRAAGWVQVGVPSWRDTAARRLWLQHGVGDVVDRWTWFKCQLDHHLSDDCPEQLHASVQGDMFSTVAWSFTSSLLCQSLKTVLFWSSCDDDYCTV